MKINDVHEMWEKDCRIDTINLEKTSVETPIIHAKYLRMYSTATLKLRALEEDQKKLLKLKWLYYNGKMTKEQMEENGFEYDPFDGLKVLKGEMNYYYDADSDIQKSVLKIAYQKEMIATLKEIVDALKWRHQTIRNIIEMRRFEAGA